MFRPSYLKEGPGIAKDAPEKTGAAWVGETLAREFWQLVKLNVLFLLCCLPVVTFGAARAAMARCTVNMARDVPNGFFPALLGMLLLCVTAAFFQNFWAVQAAVDIPFAAAAKNAWLLCLLRPGMTVLGLGVNALLLIPAVLFFPLSLPYVLLFPCGLSGFASGMIGWSSCKRYLIR